MDDGGQNSKEKKGSTRSLVLGVCTVALFIFFTIPSIPGWWAVFNLPGLDTRILETEKQRAEAQEAVERLEARKLMSPSDPTGVGLLYDEMTPLKEQETSLTARLDYLTQLQIMGKKVLAMGSDLSFWARAWVWLKHVLEFGGLVGALLHTTDAVKRILSWLSPLKWGA